MKFKQMFLTKHVLCLLFGLISFSAFAQKDILLYSSDITKWGAVDGSSASSDDVSSATGEGEGFKVAGKPVINPSGTVLGDVGFFTHSSGTTTVLEFPPFTFIAGGAIEILIAPTTASNGRPLVIPGADAVMIEGPVPIPASTRYDRIGVSSNGATTPSTTMMGATNITLDNAKVGVYHSGNTWVSSGGDKPYIVTFRFPPSFTGTKVIKLGEDDWHKDIAIAGIKVYTAVGTVPYVASTNYAPAPSSGLTMKGTVNGAAQSGTVVNAPVNIKGWNIGTHDVRLSIEGTDAVKFNLVDDAANGFTLQPDGSLIVSNAKITAAAGTPINIQFSPSVKAGISNAILKIEEIGGTSAPYKVTLSGLTGESTPQILADTARIAFWGSPISATTKKLSLAGLNLTGNVSISITGTGASKFSVTPLNIAKQTALNGTSIDITYTADINFPSTATAMLEIKSAGAPTVYVPLTGYTTEGRPELLELKFVISPAGSGFVTASPAGTMYLKGTNITAEVIPEKGYSISYWSDAGGNKSAKRSFRVSDLKQGTITIFLIKDNGIIINPTSKYVAYMPDESKGQITGTGFLAQWSFLKDTDETTNPVTKYTVVVYNQDGTLKSSTDVGLVNSYSVTGLAPGEFYRYEIVATKQDNATKATDRVGTIQITPGPSSFVCGQ